MNLQNFYSFPECKIKKNLLPFEIEQFHKFDVFEIFLIENFKNFSSF